MSDKEAVISFVSIVIFLLGFLIANMTIKAWTENSCIIGEHKTEQVLK